jgi:hypothetical protein
MKVMKMMLSKFIVKLERIAKDGKHPKTTQLIGMLKQNLNEKGDIEIDVDALCNHLGLEF